MHERRRLAITTLRRHFGASRRLDLGLPQFGRGLGLLGVCRQNCVMMPPNMSAIGLISLPTAGPACGNEFPRLPKDAEDVSLLCSPWRLKVRLHQREQVRELLLAATPAGHQPQEELVVLGRRLRLCRPRIRIRLGLCCPRVRVRLDLRRPHFRVRLDLRRLKGGLIVHHGHHGVVSALRGVLGLHLAQVPREFRNRPQYLGHPRRRDRHRHRSRCRGQNVGRARRLRGRRPLAFQLHHRPRLIVEGLPPVARGAVPDDVVVSVLRNGLVVAAAPQIGDLLPEQHLICRKVHRRVLHAPVRRAPDEAHELDVLVLGRAVVPREERVGRVDLRRRLARGLAEVSVGAPIDVGGAHGVRS